MGKTAARSTGWMTSLMPDQKCQKTAEKKDKNQPLLHQGEHAAKK